MVSKKQSFITWPWPKNEAQLIVRHLENKGLLDFEALEEKTFPSLCQRASCWPINMPNTLDERALGVEKDEVNKEEKLQEYARQQNVIARRSIDLAGNSLDTGDQKFAEKLQDIVDSWVSNDEKWFDRCRKRNKLAEFNNINHSNVWSNTVAKAKGNRRREQKLSDEQKQAMGMVSERLAFHYFSKV